MENMELRGYVKGGSFTLRMPASWYVFDLNPGKLDDSVDKLLDMRMEKNPGLASRRAQVRTLLIESLRELLNNGGVFSAIYEAWDNGEVISINLSISTVETSQGRILPIEAVKEAYRSDVDPLDTVKLAPVKEILRLPSGDCLEEKKLIPLRISKKDVVIEASTQFFIPASGRLYILTFATPNLTKIDKYYPLMRAIASTFVAS